MMKKYNDALQRAKELHESGNALTKIQMEIVFPELAESEDERVRKALMTYLYNDFHNIHQLTPRTNEYESWIAWLEKQATRKPISVSFGETDEEHLNAVEFVLEHCGVEEGVKNEMCAWLEKQKEQKPIMIQWTGNNLKEVIDFTGKSPKFGEWFKSWDEYEDYVHSHGNILKLFCEDGSHYEVPVGAWIVKTPDGYNVASQSKFVQQPAEWNEEDEKNLQGVIDEIEANKNTAPSYDTPVYDKFLSWLKSLRQQSKWKPSDEQMDALRVRLNCGPLGAIDENLQNLYNDLKKL